MTSFLAAKCCAATVREHAASGQRQFLRLIGSTLYLLYQE